MESDARRRTGVKLREGIRSRKDRRRCLYGKRMYAYKQGGHIFAPKSGYTIQTGQVREEITCWGICLHAGNKAGVLVENGGNRWATGLKK
jgi:hypothetical protein